MGACEWLFFPGEKKKFPQPHQKVVKAATELLAPVETRGLSEPFSVTKQWSEGEVTEGK